MDDLLALPGRGLPAEPRLQRWMSILFSVALLVSGPVGFWICALVLRIPLFPLALAAAHLSLFGEYLFDLAMAVASLAAVVTWGWIARLALLEIGVRKRFVLPLVVFAVAWAVLPVLLLSLAAD